jgi:hypothetical protein
MCIAHFRGGDVPAGGKRSLIGLSMAVSHASEMDCDAFVFDGTSGAMTSFHLIPCKSPMTCINSLIG